MFIDLAAALWYNSIMFSNIKKLKEIRQRAKAVCDGERDGDGKSVIRMRVNDDSDFLSPYSTNDEPTVSDGVAGFLDGAVQPLDLKRDIHIVIAGDMIDSAEEDVYRGAIRNHYAHRIADTERTLKTNAISSLVMLLIAVAILVVYIVFQIRGGFILLELLDIAAWVFAWEAVDLFFLERRIVKHDRLKCLRLFDAGITFVQAEK